MIFTDYQNKFIDLSYQLIVDVCDRMFTIVGVPWQDVSNKAAYKA